MPESRQNRSRYICVISDATGATAARVVRATLSQFKNQEVLLDLVGKVKTAQQIRKVVDKAKELNGLIAYTLVDPTLRSEIASLASEAGIATVDLIGPLMSALSEFLTTKPAYEPGLFQHPGEEHHQRLEAVSFAVRHDDGQCLGEIAAADIVIVGPSRTSKTPISVYLAHTRGLNVANIPLALGVEPFQELNSLKPGRIVALTLNANLLSRIREERLKDMGNPNIEYASLAYVQRELQYCHEIYRRPPPWPVIDITGKSIEEIASAICTVMAG